MINIPHFAQDIIQFSQYFESLLETQAFTIPSLFRRSLAKFAKGSIVNEYSRQIAERDLEAIHNDVLVKRARKILAETIAQKGGWISIDQIRKSLIMVKETVKEKAEKALKRAIRAEEIQVEKANKVVKSRLKQLDMDI